METTVTDPAVAGELIVQIVMALVLGAFGTSFVTTFAVGLLKRVFTGISAPTLSFAVAAVLWIAVTLYGVVTGNEQPARDFISLLENILPPIVAFVSTLIGAPIIHEAANKYNVAVIGSKRTPGYKS